MTILKVTVEDEQADLLRKLLQEVPYVKNIEEDHQTNDNPTSTSESSNEKIKKILDKAKGKGLFKDIKDPVEWQRELRREWDRDF